MTHQQPLEHFGEPPFKRTDPGSETWVYGPLCSLDPEPDSTGRIRFLNKDFPNKRYWYELILQDNTVTQIYSDTCLSPITALTLENDLSQEAQEYFNKTE